MRIRISLLALTAVGLLGCTDGAPPAAVLQGSQQGVPTGPGATSLELDGRPFDLWEGRASARATVLVFTRTDCPISNRYAPTLRALDEAYRDRGVDFFLVYVDPREDADSIRRHRQEYQYVCPGFRDPLHQLVAECGATVTPEAVVFDARRKIAYRGRIDDLYAALGQSRTAATTHELADAIEAVVAGHAVAEPTTKAVGCYIADLK